MFESIRSSCTECSGPIVWLKPQDMDSEIQRLAKEASEWLGEPATSVWRCTRSTCAEVGFFGGLHTSF